MATVAVPGASNNAATGTWAAMAAGAAVSVVGPATSRICPTTAAKKVLNPNEQPLEPNIASVTDTPRFSVQVV